MTVITRAELLALTPEIYLAAGYLAPNGTPIPGLAGDLATAAATQLAAAGLPPQELGLTAAAIALHLEQTNEGEPPDRLHTALEAALRLVANAINQRNNRGLVTWLDACAARVATDADLAAFTTHLSAVNRQYAMMVSLMP